MARIGERIPERVGLRSSLVIRGRKESRMLVLSRQRDETIMIGDDVQITVVDIRGDKVRLGITAPRHIQVHRKEVYDAIKRENEQAAKIRQQDVADVIEREGDPSKNENDTQRREPPRPKRKDQEDPDRSN